VVIEKITPASLGGAVRLDWRPEGFVWEFEAPVAQLVAPDTPARAMQDACNPSGGIRTI
jgi:hypothetical protein